MKEQVDKSKRVVSEAVGAALETPEPSLEQRKAKFFAQPRSALEPEEIAYSELFTLAQALREDAAKYDKASKMEFAAVLLRYADRITNGDFIKNHALSSPRSVDAERDKLKRQIGVLAMAFSAKGGRYQRGGKPNAANIAREALAIAQAVPHANIAGLGDTEMRQSIAAGVQLLMAELSPDI